MLDFLGKIVDFGEDAFDSVVDAGENILNKTNTFIGNVKGGLDMAVEEFNYLKDSFNKQQYGERFRDTLAKGSLSAGSSILTTASRGYNKLSELSDSKIARSTPILGSVLSANKLSKDYLHEDLLKNASSILEKGSEALQEDQRFIDKYDLDSIKWEEAIHDPLKFAGYGIETMGRMLPATLTAIVGGILGGAPGAFATTFSMEGGGQYQEAKQYGASDSDADKALAITGTINGMLETLSLGVLGKFGSSVLNNAGLKKLSGELSKKVSNSVINKLSKMAGKSTIGEWASMMATEVGTEELQNIVSNAVAQAYDENRGLFDGWLETLRQTAIFSGATGMGGVVTANTLGKINNATKDIPNKQGGFISSYAKNGTKEQQKEEKNIPEQSKLHAEAKKYETADEFIKSVKNDYSYKTYIYNKVAKKIRDVFDKEEGIIFSKVDDVIDTVLKNKENLDSYIVDNISELSSIKNKLHEKEQEAEELEKSKGDIKKHEEVLKEYVDIINAYRNEKNVDTEDLHENIQEIKDKILNEIGYKIDDNNKRFLKDDIESLIENGLDIDVSLSEYADSVDVNINADEELAELEKELTNKILKLKDLKDFSYREKERLLNDNKDRLKKIDEHNLYSYIDDKTDEIYSANADLLEDTKTGITFHTNIRKSTDYKKNNSIGKISSDIAINDETLKKIWEEAHGKKFQEALSKHQLNKHGYITTDEAVKQAMKLPLFRALSARGQVQLKKQLSNPEALGSYVNGIISFVENPHKTTLPHEIFHATLDLALNEHERKAVLNIAREEAGRYMNDRDAEEWLAQEFADWYVDQNDNTISGRLKRIFKKIRNFINRLINVDSKDLEGLFRTLIDEDLVKAITDFKDNGGISAVRNQETIVSTIEFFERETFWKKKKHKAITVSSEINRIKKPLIRDYIRAKFETEFAGREEIDMDEFKRSIISDLLQTEIIELSGGSGSYSNYGLNRINYDYRVGEDKTYIINTNFHHGVRGHFSSAFDKTTTKDDLEIREIKAGTYEVEGQTENVSKDQYYVVKKGLNRENLQSGVYGVFDTEQEAQEYINNFADRKTEEAGMLGHFRAVHNTDENRLDIVEMQSDVFQENFEPLSKLYRTNKRLMEGEISDKRQELLKKVNFVKTRKEDFINKLESYLSLDEIDNVKTHNIEYSLFRDNNIYRFNKKFHNDFSENQIIDKKNIKKILDKVEENYDKFIDEYIVLHGKTFDENFAYLKKQEEQIRQKYSDKEGVYFASLTIEEREKQLKSLDEAIETLHKSDRINPVDDVNSILLSAFNLDNIVIKETKRYLKWYNNLLDWKYDNSISNDAFIEKYKDGVKPFIDFLTDKRDDIREEIEALKSGNLTKEQQKELALSEQFLSLKNNYPEKIITHAIRQGAVLGAEKVRFATPMTVAFVENYVESDADADYLPSAGRYRYGDVAIGSSITDHLGNPAIVTAFDDMKYDYVSAEDGGDLVVVDYSDRLTDELSERDIKYEILYNELDRPYKIVYSETSDIHYGEEAYLSVLDKDGRKNFSIIDIESDKYRNIASKYGKYTYDENNTDIIEPDEANNDTGKFVVFDKITSQNIKTFDTYEEAKEYRKSLYGKEKKGTYYKYLEKKRDDLRLVEDDNGFTWWETDIKPEDRASVELFQTKSQIKKKQELDKLEGEKYLRTIQINTKEEYIKNNPLKYLSKYANRNGELPEVSGSKKHGTNESGSTSKFGKYGDEIVLMYGEFEDSEDARLQYEKYKKDRDEFKKEKQEFIEWKKEVAPKIRKLKEEIKLLKRGEREGVAEYKKQLTKLQDEFIKFIEKSGISLHDRAKFIRSIKNIKTARNLEVQLEKAEKRISKMKELSDKRILKNKIFKLIRKTKTKLKSGKRFGKFTPEIQKVFDDIYHILSLNKEDLKNLQSDIYTKMTEDYNSVSIDDSLKLQIIDAFGNIDERNEFELFVVYNNLKSLYETGKALKELSDFNRYTDVLRLRELVIDNVGDVIKRKGEDLPYGLKEFIKNAKGSFLSEVALDWDGLMETLSKYAGDQTIKEALSVFDSEKKFVELTEDMRDDSISLFESAYNIKPKKITNFVRNYLNDVVELGTFKDTEGKKVELKMTKDVAIKKYMDFQSPEIKEAYRKSNNFTDEMMNAIVNSLSEQDKQFADGMLDIYETHYDKVNEVFRKIFNVDLPKVTKYSPITRTGFKKDIEQGMGEFLDQIINSGIAVSAIKSRVKNNNPILDTGAFQSFTNHMNQTNYFIAWGEKVRLLKSVFGDPKIQEVISDKFGKGFYSGIQTKIQMFIDNGAVSRLPKFLKTLKSGFIISRLAMKPLVMAKQFVSIVAVLEKISPVEFIDGVLDFAKNPKKIWDLMNEESLILRNRGETFDYHINDAIKIDQLKKMASVKEKLAYLMFNVKFGDKFAGLVSAYAYRKKLLKDGVPLKEAINKYEQYIHDTQQSSFLSKLRNVQVKSWSQLFTLFMTSQAQFFQKEALAINSLFKEGGTKPENLKRVARVIFIYHFVLPVMFQFMANMGRTDDEAKKDYLRAMILGSFNGIIIFRDFADALLRALFGQYVFNPTIPIYSAFKDISDELKKLTADDISEKEVAEALANIGVDNAGIFLGFPSDFTKRFFEGATDIADGYYKEGILNIFGYSDYQVSGGKTYQERKAQKKYAPVVDVYNEIKKAVEAGDKEKAKRITQSLDEDKKELLKKYNAYIKAKKTRELNKKMNRVAKEILKLKEKGRKEDALNIIKSLTKDEKKALEKQLKKLTEDK